MWWCGLCFYQGKIFMYGGKIDSSGNVSSQLWVFHIQNQTWVQLSPRAKEQYAVVGHSAHIVPPVEEGDSPVMLVLFGHCPLYGYISQVQEYNIGKKSLRLRAADLRPNASVCNNSKLTAATKVKLTSSGLVRCVWFI